MSRMLTAEEIKEKLKKQLKTITMIYTPVILHRQKDYELKNE